MTLTLRYAARSDRGLIRGGNQDSVYAGPRLLAVADGMGGMAAGDVASNIVIACMAPLDEDVSDGAMIDALRSGVDLANQQVREIVADNPSMEGMGTTLTAMLFSGARIGMVHIGDSRAYLLREGEFTQITKDDTYVQMLVDEGRITPEEANSHPQRSLLTRALDGRDVDPDYSMRSAKTGDRYLLCSDGLSSVVSFDTIGTTLREYADPNQCADRLIQLALRGGGPDNITVIVADMTNHDIVESAPVVGGAASRDRGMATSADPSMSSARGAALGNSREDTHAHDDSHDEKLYSTTADRGRPKKHPLRTMFIVILIIGLSFGGLWYGWNFTQSQYYVGATNDGTVVIFQGVPGKVAWFDLSSVYESSNLRLSDLTPVAQSNVKRGIPASSQSEARRTLEELRDPKNTASQQGTPEHPQESPGPQSSSSPTNSLSPSASSASGLPSDSTQPTPAGPSSRIVPGAGGPSPPANVPPSLTPC